MPLKKDGKKKTRKKRLPSFTLPKDPYKYQHGATATTNQSSSKSASTVSESWTLLRPGKRSRDTAELETGRVQKGLLRLNDKISQNLDVNEIGSWLRTQKDVYVPQNQKQPPPSIPKRSPETKLSRGSDQLQPKELDELDAALPPGDYEEDEQAPESGYITPEQQGSEVEYSLGGAGYQRQGSNSSSGSTAGNRVPVQHQSPQHVPLRHGTTTRIQAEVHPISEERKNEQSSCQQSSIYEDGRQHSVISQGSMPRFSPPPPPEGAMAPQMNPIHRASSQPVSRVSASSGSSTGTLYDPYQPDAIYEQFLPPGGMDVPSRYGASSPKHCYADGANTRDLYERTLPMPQSHNQNVPNSNNSSLRHRPLPMPPGDEAESYYSRHVPETLNRSLSSPPVGKTYPPPPTQFADHRSVSMPYGDQFGSRSPTRSVNFPRTMPKPAKSSSGVDMSPTTNNLPFPVKLRPIGSPLMQRSNDIQNLDACSDTSSGVSSLSSRDAPPTPPITGMRTRTIPPPTKPKIGAIPKKLPALPGSLDTVQGVSFPPPPPPLPCGDDSYHGYAEVGEDLPPPPPMGGMCADLAQRVTQWTLSNQTRPTTNTSSSSSSSSSSSGPSHAALINQIQTGIKLRKSVHGTRLFDAAAPPIYRPDPTSPNSKYGYLDYIETSSVDSSSSGCHSNCSLSNSTSDSPGQQTLMRNPDMSNMPGNQDNPSIGQRFCYQGIDASIDVSQLPGYQPVPMDCPTWKASMMHKKNQQIIDDMKGELIKTKKKKVPTATLR